MSGPDFFAIFNAIPSPCLVLLPDDPHFTIVEANDAHLQVTMTQRPDLIGKGLFEAFPDNPEDPDAKGVANLKASLRHVLKEKKTHQMAVQKYDIPLPDKSGFELRYWLPKNIPVLDQGGQLIYLLHVVEDVTTEVLMKEVQQRSKQEYESLFEQHPDVVFSLDLNGNFTQVNQAAVRLLERTEQELLALNFRELALDADVDRLETYFKQCCSGTPFNIRVPYSSASGKRRDLNLFIMPLIVNSKVEGMYGIARDETEQVRYQKDKQMISTISEIFNQEKDLHDCMPDLLTKLCIYTDCCVGEAWMGNVDNSEILLSASVAIQPESVQLEKAVYDTNQGLVASAWKKREVTVMDDLPNNTDFPQQEYARANGLKTGIAVPIVLKNQVLAVFVLYTRDDSLNRDWITEGLLAHLVNEIHRKKVEYELNQFFNLSPDMLAILGYDGYFKKVNSVFSKVLGYTIAELLVKPFFEFIHPEDRPSSEVEFENLIRKIATEAFENRYLTKNGETRWLSWTANAMEHGRMIFAVGRDVTEKKRLEQAIEREHQRFASERKEAYLKLMKSEREVRSFALQLNHVLEEERARIAREIHDEFGQQLSGLRLLIQSLECRLNRGSEGVFQAMLANVDQTIQSLRKFATELRPGILDTLGLLPSIEWLVKDFEMKTGIVCDLQLKQSKKPRELNKDISICCFRICQEALTNVIKHSGATHVTVRLNVSTRKLFMRIADNGRGIVNDGINKPFSTGLLGMRERASLLGGTLFVKSEPDKGTRVELSIDISNRNADTNR